MADENKDPEEELAKMRAAADQLKAGMAETAGMIAAYYKALIVEQVPSDLAYALTISYQESFMRMGLE